MDSERLHSLIAAIPSGRWVSYGDVADALGSRNFRAAANLNQRLCDMRPDGAHRVLRTDGRVGHEALGDPEGVRLRLEAEGVEFDALSRASREARLRTAELLERAGLEPLAREPVTAVAEPDAARAVAAAEPDAARAVAAAEPDAAAAAAEPDAAAA